MEEPHGFRTTKELSPRGVFFRLMLSGMVSAMIDH